MYNNWFFFCVVLDLPSRTSNSRMPYIMSVTEHLSMMKAASDLTDVTASLATSSHRVFLTVFTRIISGMRSAI